MPAMTLATLPDAHGETLASAVAIAAALAPVIAPDNTPAAPEWVHLLPAGTVIPIDGRAAWLLDDPAGVAAASLAAGRPLPIDYDHATDRAAPNGHPAPAAGWITTIEARPDGLWGRVEWTPEGARAVAHRHYRFLSPVFRHGKNKPRRISKIERAALTNNPAIPTLSALADASSPETHPMDELSLKLRQILGLADNADEKAICTAVETLKTKATEDAQALASAQTASQTLENQVTALAARVQAMEEDRIARKIADQLKARKFPPAQRDDMVALCRADEALFDRLMATATPIDLGDRPDDAPPQAGTDKPPLSAEDQAVCAALNLSEDQYRAAAQK